MTTKHTGKECLTKEARETKRPRPRRRNDPSDAIYSGDPRWLEAQEEAREGDLRAEAGDDPCPD